MAAAGLIWIDCAVKLPSELVVPFAVTLSPIFKSVRDPFSDFMTWVELEKSTIWDPPLANFKVKLLSSWDRASSKAFSFCWIDSCCDLMSNALAPAFNSASDISFSFTEDSDAAKSSGLFYPISFMLFSADANDSL